MIVFDELQYAQKMLANGFINKNLYLKELHILSKYYYYLGMTPEQVEQAMIKFNEKYMRGFVYSEDYIFIDTVVRLNKNKKLVTGVKVEITKKELDTIAKLNNPLQEYIAFVMLVIYKFKGCKAYKISKREMFNLASLKLRNSTRDNILYELTKAKLINMNGKGLNWVTFADDTQSSTPLICIINFDNLTLYYKQYRGENIINCKECDKPVETNTHNKMYCDECKSRAEKDKYNRYNQKRKKRKNLPPATNTQNPSV